MKKLFTNQINKSVSTNSITYFMIFALKDILLTNNFHYQFSVLYKFTNFKMSFAIEEEFGSYSPKTN
jgi:hypothetical protein